MACTNSFETYFAYYEQAWLPANPGGSFAAFLDELTILPTSANLCCNDNCQDTPYILLGENTPAFNYETAIGLNLKACCTNARFSLNNFISLLSQTYNNSPSKIKDGLNYKTCCNKDYFNECVNELDTYLNSPVFKEFITGNNNLTTGILEINTLGGSIGFCLLKDALLQRSPTVGLEYILAIFNLGLVLKCTSQGIVITSVTTYIANQPFP